MNPCRAGQPAFLLIAFSLFLPGIADADGETGSLEILELESDVFSNTRRIRIWLPPGYDKPDHPNRQYPVVYLNDGQDLFDAETSVYFDAEWQIDETLARLIQHAAIEPLIVVGIDHAGRRVRAKEYLPWPDEFLSPPEPSPMGGRYADFLADEVIPFVESRYPVRTDRAGRTLGGSSYGGLIALYVVTNRPDLFGQLLLESPSLYVDDDHVLHEVVQKGIAIDRAYLGVGTNEVGVDDCGENATNNLAVQGVRDLSTILLRSGLPDNRLLLNIEECAIHSPSAWSRRFPDAIKFLFPR